MNIDKPEFYDMVYITNRKLHPEWRYGQTVFNVMYDLYPEKANKYRGSSIDPFHNDDNVDEFIDACFDVEEPDYN